MADAFPSFAYLDTSALVKRYVTEPGTSVVRRLLRRHRVLSSALLPVEIVSAFHRRRSDGALSEAAFNRLQARAVADGQSWQLVALADDVLAAARRWVLTYGVRTVDAVHLASAELVYEAGVQMPFVTADGRQAAAATARGFAVVRVG